MKDIAKIFHVNQLSFDFEGSYNIAPSQTVPIVVQDKETLLVPARWGFIPAWVENPTIGQRMINAKEETVAERPAFRKAFHSQRCIVSGNVSTSKKETHKAAGIYPALYRQNHGHGRDLQYLSFSRRGEGRNVRHHHNASK